MDISSILPKKKETAKELFWSLVIEPDWLQAGVWEIKDGQANLLSSGPPTGWKTDEELVDGADTALSGAVGDLPEDSPEPVKTVFGVSTDWVSDGEIKSENLEKLKKLCENLSLKPAGFVVLPEAIAHFLKSEEGSPLSGVLVGVGEENLEVSVFRLGKLVGTQPVARSVSVSEDVLEGLVRFSSSEPFPSRFILYDGKEGELEEVRQNLVGAEWGENEKVKFLHSPKVEIFKPDNKVLAVALAGAAEMAGVKEARVQKSEQEEEVLDEKEVVNVYDPKDTISPEEVGFVVGEDVSQGGEEKELPRPGVAQASFPPAQGLQKKTRFNFSAPVFTKIKERFFSFLDALGSVGGLGSMGKQKRVVVAASTVVGLFVVLFLLWWFVPRATLTVYVSPRTLSQSTEITIAASGTTDISGRRVAGEAVSDVQSGEKTKSTTGTKTVGEAAKGTVEVRNGTSDDLDLAAGTTIVSSGDLEFELAESVSVSAAVSTTEPGTVTVDVEASNIGAEYNLANGEVFRVGNFPKADVDAQAISDFSGGSSRQISAVSDGDLESLLNELTLELEEKAKEAIASDLSEDTLLIEESISSTVEEENFSAQEGDESDTLRLSLEVEVVAVVVKRGDLFDLVKGILEGEIPEGYVLRENQIDFVFDVSDVDGGTYTLDADIEANLLPELDTNEIAKKVVGKSTERAEEYLATIPGFSRAQVRLRPSLPGRLGTLPHVVGKIEVEVAAER